ncbi:hypothetical protein N7539_004389 [Penicillium diatomitis]|uniref:Uncharacterized protein n=1 Tax=Penicillium diatomitis TaxID=2819901 RepID=A0A9W9XDW6_9EURO|nr:uncharacterized protein N7539_004389 [Penicillium diatomitis]KAJ5489499.1 hypothetical protein N7539_004389 [Penicillium diatomitis]
MPDMYTFQAGSKPLDSESRSGEIPSFTPNILPCRVHHDGPVESNGRFWITQTDEKDDQQTAHFRGRRLRGRRVAVPEGYRGTQYRDSGSTYHHEHFADALSARTGVIVSPTDRVISGTQGLNGDRMEDGESDPEEPVKILEAQGTFDEMMVWGHENLPAADDPFVKGVEEWIRFAETMHGGSTAAPKEDSGK